MPPPAGPRGLTGVAQAGNGPPLLLGLGYIQQSGLLPRAMSRECVSRGGRPAVATVAPAVCTSSGRLDGSGHAPEQMLRRMRDPGAPRPQCWRAKSPVNAAIVKPGRSRPVLCLASAGGDGPPDPREPSRTVQRQSNGQTGGLTLMQEFKGILNIAIPSFLSLSLDPLMTLVDTAIVGQLGATPLAATGISGMVFTYSQGPFYFTPIITPAIAASVAQGNVAFARRYGATCLLLSFITGAAVAGGLLFGGASILVAAGTVADVLPEAVSCLNARSVGAPALLSMLACHAIFRANKDTWTPLWVTILASVQNLVLDIAFVFWLGWGAAGAALATAMAEWTGAVVLLILLLRKGYLKQRDLSRLPRPGEAGSILRQVLVVSLPHVVSYSFLGRAGVAVNQLGAVPLAAHEILRQVWNAAVIAFEAFSLAAQTLIAEAVGSNDLQRAQQLSLRVVYIMAISGSLIGGSVFFFRTGIASIFSTSDAVVGSAAGVLVLVASILPLDGIAFALDGILIGGMQAGYSARSWGLSCMIGMAVIQFCGCRVTDCLMNIWAVQQFITVLAIALFLIRILSPDKSPIRGRWKHVIPGTQ